MPAESQGAGGDPKVLAQVIAEYQAAASSQNTNSSTKPRSTAKKVTSTKKAGSRTGSSSGSEESLMHAIQRMSAQGYSQKQVAGQVRRWHPNLSSGMAEMLVAITPKGRSGGSSLTGLLGWLGDKGRKGVHDIVHYPATTVRTDYNILVLGSRDIGSRFGESVGLVSKKRERKDIQNISDYTRGLLTAEVETLEHPLRDPVGTLLVLHDLKKKSDDISEIGGKIKKKASGDR